MSGCRFSTKARDPFAYNVYNNVHTHSLSHSHTRTPNNNDNNKKRGQFTLWVSPSNDDGGAAAV